MSIKISQSLLLGLSLVISSSLFAAVKEYQLVIEEGQSISPVKRYSVLQ